MREMDEAMKPTTPITTQHDTNQIACGAVGLRARPARATRTSASRLRAARLTVALICAFIVATFAFAGSAFAVTVYGADFHASGAAIDSGEIDVLNVEGKAGDTIFITVENKGTTIAKNLPYVIGADAEQGDSSTWVAKATLDITGLNINALDGSYTIKAYEDRASSKELYAGAIYGVYADLEDGASKLIGTRTASSSEASARTFVPPTTVYDGDHAYRLASDEPSGKDALHYTYEEYDPATTIDAQISYVDHDGNVVATDTVPGIAYNKEAEKIIPEVVTAENGDLYRTVFFGGSITAKNPGALSFKIYCVKMTDADKALSGYYLANIRMVDEDGAIIASDSVDVTGNFTYTAPSTIYKRELQTSIV